MESDLRSLLSDEISLRLGEHRPQFGVGDQVATFASPSGAMGDVVVEVDGSGVVVHITGMTHGHFDDPDETPAETATSVVNFLADLFHDKVVVWRSKRAGGWFYASARRRWLFSPRRATNVATWSGPWKNPAK